MSDEFAKSYEEYALLMSQEAEVAGGARCIKGEAVFWLPGGYAVREGHIYSDSGRDEFGISRVCEYHFDDWFKEEDE